MRAARLYPKKKKKSALEGAAAPKCRALLRPHLYARSPAVNVYADPLIVFAFRPAAPRRARFASLACLLQKTSSPTAPYSPVAFPVYWLFCHAFQASLIRRPLNVARIRRRINASLPRRRATRDRILSSFPKRCSQIAWANMADSLRLRGFGRGRRADAILCLLSAAVL